MAKQIQIKKAKKDWHESRGSDVIKGAPLHHNFALEKNMQDRLHLMVSKMAKEVEKEVEKLFTEHSDYFATDASVTSQARILLNRLNEKFESIFTKRASWLSNYMVRRADKHSKSQIKKSLEQLSGGIRVNTKELSEKTKENLKASVAEATDYIRSIQSEYMTKVRGEVFRSITSGSGMRDLVPFFQRIQKSTKSRAKLIALDQTRKVTASLNMARMSQHGIKKFEWNHSSSGLHPRETHMEFDGKIYPMDEPPYDKSVGKRVFPAELPNCRCFLTPVISLDDEEE